jgi:GST-like protein
LDTRLEGRDYIAAGEYTIADMAIVPWLTTLEKFYQATEYLGLKEFKNVVAYIERVSTREKYIIGSQVCSIH